MKTPELLELITSSMTLLINSADELRDLDQELGDGDLGITISAGAKAVIEAVQGMTGEELPSEVSRVCAKAFANANPSTMAALVAGGLLAGSKTWASLSDVTLTDAEAFIRAAAGSIAQRGKSQVGDKTILDAMIPACDALRNAQSPDSALDEAIAAAGHSVIETRDLQSRRGRASWLQDRSIGLQDPGATAFLRALEAWRDASTGVEGERLAVVK